MLENHSSITKENADKTDAALITPNFVTETESAASITNFAEALKKIPPKETLRKAKERKPFRRTMLLLMSTVVYATILLSPQVARASDLDINDFAQTIIENNLPQHESENSASEMHLEAVDLNALGWELPFETEDGQEYFITQGPTVLMEDGLACSLHTTHIGLDTYAIDISLNKGHQIQSTQSGEIAFAGWMGTYGNTVIVRHTADGYLTQYSHLDTIDENLKTGESVTKGQEVGKGGNSGDGYKKYHLHFAVLKDDQFDFNQDLTDDTFFQQIGASVPINYPVNIEWYGEGVFGSCSPQRFEASITSSTDLATDLVKPTEAITTNEEVSHQSKVVAEEEKAKQNLPPIKIQPQVFPDQDETN